MKKIIFGLNLMIMGSALFADINPKQLAHDLELNPERKAISQWKRIFQDERRMKRYGISTLSAEEQSELKDYLLKNAKDANLEEGF